MKYIIILVLLAVYYLYKISCKQNNAVPYESTEYRSNHISKRVHLIAILIITVSISTACSSNKNIASNDISPNEATNEMDDIISVSENNESTNDMNITSIPENTEASLDPAETEEVEKPNNTKSDLAIHRVNLPWELTKDIGEGLIGYFEPETELWGYCDYNGEIIIPAKYSYISSFTDGYADVTEDNSDFQIDKVGNIVDNVSQETPGIYDVAWTGFNTVSSDLIFDWTTKYIFDETNHFENKTIKDSDLNDVIKISELLELVPSAKGIGISDDYISVMDFKNYGEYEDITTALIDYSKNIIIEPGKYSYIIPLDKEHLWVANYDHTYGLIDKAGNTLIEMSDKQVALLLTEEDKNKQHNEGMLVFEPSGPIGTDLEYLHCYQVINSSSKNYILIIDKGERAIASAEIFDLDLNKVVGTIPSFSLAHSAAPVYILPDLILHPDSMQCYDYEGNLITTSAFPETGYHIETVSVDNSTTIVQLEGGYLDGPLSGYGYRENMYISISSSVK